MQSCWDEEVEDDEEVDQEEENLRNKRSIGPKTESGPSLPRTKMGRIRTDARDKKTWTGVMRTEDCRS